MQGWLNHRSPQEAEIILQLFENSFADLYRYAIQNLSFKMDVLEAFVIKQVYSNKIFWKYVLIYI